MIIGNRYYWYDYESGWYEVGKYEHDRLQKIEDELQACMQKFISPEAKLRGGTIIISSNMADPDDNRSDFRDVWEESKPGTKSGLVKYFKPAHQESQLDKYGQPLTEDSAIIKRFRQGPISDDAG